MTNTFNSPTQPSLNTKAHIRYALRCLRLLPTAYESDDNSRLTFGFFAIGGLSLLGAMDRLKIEERRDYVDWIYNRWNSDLGGFSGFPNLDRRLQVNHQDALNQPHITHTYAALLLLGLLSTPDVNDTNPTNPYQNLDVPKLLQFLTGCQRSNGSFSPFPSSSEQDVRFVYCAAAILAILNIKPEEVIDVQSTVSFLKSCRRYDGGYGQAPRLESQGGTTYCALAALSLLNSLADAQSNEEAVDTTKWLVSRQTEFFDQASDDTDSEPETLDNGSHLATASELAANQNRDEVDTPCVQHLIAGFQGRPGKALDACYSFWCTAALKIIQTHPVFASTEVQDSNNYLYHDPRANINFLLQCQSKQWGGLARSPDELPDVYHNYLALASISLSSTFERQPVTNNISDPEYQSSGLGEQNGLAEHDSLLNVPSRTLQWIKQCFP